MPDLGKCEGSSKSHDSWMIFLSFKTLIRISEEAAATWKKHLDNDDSKIVGKNPAGIIFSFLTQLSDNELPWTSWQICSRASCAARYTAPCALTTPTHSMCSATCRCPSPNAARLERWRWRTAWISSLRRRDWTSRIHQWVHGELKRDHWADK